MMEITPHRRRLMLEALVADDWNLYYRSPEFSATIKALSEMLPAWMERIADEASTVLSARADAIVDRALGESPSAIPPMPVAADLLARLSMDER